MPVYPQNRYRLPLVLGALLIISLVVYFVMIRPQQKYYENHSVKIHGIFFLKPVSVSPFTLIDNHHHEFNQENLRHRWSFVFFGFTRCTKVCPMTLDALNKMYQLLQKKLPASELPQIVFITVDPENDTIAKLNEYVSAFNSRFLGARTTIEKTAALEKLFFVTATKISDPGKNQYSFNHSTEIILVNPDAQIQAYFSFPPQPLQLAEDYFAILKKYK
jgi:protein SCO1